MSEQYTAVVLTVADHEANGFVKLAAFRFNSEEDAREAIALIDSRITDEMEPDLKTAPFTFILDLASDCLCDWVDTGKRQLPTQEAMRLAPDAVQTWLEARPEPDTVMNNPIPILPFLTAKGSQS